MDKKLIIATLCTLCVWSISAQVVDTNFSKQQQNLNRQQLEEQNRLRQQQAKEQEELDKERAEAQAEFDKQQAKDQARQEKAERDAQKKAEREQRRAEIGRGLQFSLDPSIGALFTTRAWQHSDIYNADGISLGFTFNLHYPLSKRWNINVGVGYRGSIYTYRNNIHCNEAGDDFVLNTNTANNLNYNNYSMLGIHSIQIPIMLSHVKDSKKEHYFGLNVGCNLATNFTANQLKDNGEYIITNSASNLKNVSKWKLDLTIGTRKPWLLFRYGVELHFNLLPTYIDGTNGNHPIHEIGVTVSL